jgi:hypothetical protein
MEGLLLWSVVICAPTLSLIALSKTWGLPRLHRVAEDSTLQLMRKAFRAKLIRAAQG